MSNNIPSPGKYRAKRIGKIAYDYKEKGALQACIPCELLNSEVAWSGIARVTIIKKNGEPFTKQVLAMSKIFGGDPSTGPFFLDSVSEEVTETEQFDVDGIQEDFIPEDAEPNTPPFTVFKINWVNPIGGNMPAPVEDSTRKELVTKFGSKFKASFGAAKSTVVPAKETAPAKTAAPAKAAAKGPPSRSNATSVTPRTLTQDECWDLIVAANPDKTEEELTQPFWDAQDQVKPGANGALSPAQWGEVAAVMGV